MVQNVGRKITLIVALLVASILLLVLRPLQMGLDLAGGTRLVYRLDFAQAELEGTLSEGESRSEVLQQQIEIIRNRIDPQGVREPILRALGEDRIEINLPGSAEVRTIGAVAPLAQPVPAEGTAPIQLAPGEKSQIGGFPGGGGVVRIGSELIRYRSRVDNELLDLQRGQDDTTIQAHESGEAVVLVSDDAIKNAIENLGDMRFLAVAQEGDFSALQTDQLTERQRLTTWTQANPSLPISVFNALPREQGGPPKGILWFPMRVVEGEAEAPLDQRSLPTLLPPPEWTFTGGDLSYVGRTSDDSGFPAVAFAMRPEARVRFGDFTEQYVRRQIAIVINDQIASAPTIEERLSGDSRITGRFSDREVEELVTVLRSGSLRIRPILEHEERVGATLGEQYVRRGAWSAGLALVVTLAFMTFYYRRLGMFASLALIVNLVLLMGAMVLLQATLTLPGIAGLILTVGMAVDANILIFDRLREEAEKGHKTPQAAKEGFDNALSAIVDGNVTTLLTALILYNIGTGPIRGFAVTLSIGILTSVFSALVVTRVLVHLSLERGTKSFPMGRWFADAKYRFMDKAIPAAVLSTVLIVGGVGLFLWLPDQRKLGIDFLGGASVKVRTEAPMLKEELEGELQKIPGEMAKSEVTPLPASSAGAGRYREYRITFKTPDSAEGEGIEQLFDREIRSHLAPILQKGPLEIEVQPGDAGTQRLAMTLYFDEQHPPQDVAQVLQGVGVTAPEVQTRGDQLNVFTATGTIPAGLSLDTLRALMETRFAAGTDSGGRRFNFSVPIPESNVIGAQVVGELRDSAIIALFLSVLLVIIYLRLRFAEYSFGIAAAVASLHDILVTLGAVAFLIWVPWIQVEMNLTLIAAFLTIFGYSLNDTIVIFDRVRENRPRIKGTLAQIVDLSINQTLSRTVITSGTTLVTTLIVLVFNFGTGNALEGFAFALTFGIITGTYSTIFIACPLLVWLEERANAKSKPEPASGKQPARTA